MSLFVAYSDPILSSKLPKKTTGRGSRMVSSLPKLLRSSSRSTMDGCRKMMLLMLLPTGDDVADMNEFRSALLARDEAELEDLRKDVRRLWGEKRAVMVWKREGCILAELMCDAARTR